MNRISEALTECGIPMSGVACEGAKYHSPTPLVVEPVLLSATMTVMLCGTCRDNVGTFLALMTASNGSLPWEVRREFGNLIRSLGQSAWEKRVEESHGV